MTDEHQECPHCGTFLPGYASVCSGCGAERTTVGEQYPFSSFIRFVFWSCTVLPLALYLMLMLWAGIVFGGIFTMPFYRNTPGGPLYSFINMITPGPSILGRAVFGVCFLIFSAIVLVFAQAIFRAFLGYAPKSDKIIWVRQNTARR